MRMGVSSINEWIQGNWTQVSKGSAASDWIRKLSSSDSRLHKESTIEKALMSAKLGDGNAQTFLLCAHMAYNPFMTFNVKQVSETTGLSAQPNPWIDFYQLSSDLHRRVITGHEARDAILALSRQFDSNEWNLLIRPTLIKDLRCGVSEKTINKICKGSLFEIPTFECQLAKDSEDHESKMRGRGRLEVKLDGVRVLAMVQGNSVTMYSRNGKVFENFTAIEQELIEALPRIRSKLTAGDQDFVFDGEVTGNSFQELMRQARRKKNAKADDSVYYVFDIIPLDSFKEGFFNAQQWKRSKKLENIMPMLKPGGKVQIMPGMEVDLDSADGRATMRNFAQASVDKGYEGIMIKNLDAPYECKRGAFWTKWKPTITVDLEIVDCEKGTGKNKGRLGAFVCEGVDNGRKIRVNVGSGFTDDNRTSYWASRRKLIGCMVEVLADAVTQNQDGSYSLRFPRFVRFRGFEPHEKM